MKWGHMAGVEWEVRWKNEKSEKCKKVGLQSFKTGEGLDLLAGSQDHSEWAQSDEKTHLLNLSKRPSIGLAPDF